MTCVKASIWSLLRNSAYFLVPGRIPVIRGMYPDLPAVAVLGLVSAPAAA
jgi:hypothetical protein